MHVVVGQPDVWPSLAHVLVSVSELELQREDNIKDAGTESLWPHIGHVVITIVTVIIVVHLKLAMH